MSFHDLKRSTDNHDIHRSLESIAFLAPLSAPVIESLLDESGQLADPPEEYWGLGMVSSDGYTFTSEVDTSETTSHGYTSPTREDFTSLVRQITATAQNVGSKKVQAVASGVSEDRIVTNANGEHVIKHGTRPVKQYYRMLLISHDIDPDTNIERFRGKFYPRVSLAEFPEEAWGEDAIQFELTFKAYVDSGLGTDYVEFTVDAGEAATPEA